MTKRDEAALRRYYCRIGSWLPCGRKQKQQIVGRVKDNVRAFLEDSPDADFARIEQRFGTPQEIAAAYVADMNMPVLLAALRTRRRILTVLIAGVIAALLLWAVGVSLVVADYHAENPSFFTEQM